MMGVMGVLKVMGRSCFVCGWARLRAMLATVFGIIWISGFR